MAEARLDRSELIERLDTVFRKNGYAGASLSAITAATGLGKGSLYHAFPGGKAEMAEAVLADIAAWFEERIFGPLDAAPDPAEGMAAMFAGVREYFDSGQRICLLGVFALDATRDRFAGSVRGYFSRWHGALAGCLRRAGVSETHAGRLAAETLAAIQGGLVLARALDDPQRFEAVLARQEARLSALLGARGRQAAAAG